MHNINRYCPDVPMTKTSENYKSPTNRWPDSDLSEQLQELGDCKVHIPKVIHKILFLREHAPSNTNGGYQPAAWPQTLSGQLEFAVNSWDQLNLAYELRKWSGIDVETYIRHKKWKDFDGLGTSNEQRSEEYLDTLRTLKAAAAKTDLARYLIVYGEGGVYSDMRMVCLADLDRDLFGRYLGHGNKAPIQWFSPCETPERMQCAFFAAAPKHPFLKIAIDMVVEHVRTRFYGKADIYPTGPGVFGKATGLYHYNRERPGRTEADHKLLSSGYNAPDSATYFPNALIGKWSPHEFREYMPKSYVENDPGPHYTFRDVVLAQSKIKGVQWPKMGGDEYRDLWKSRNYYAERDCSDTLRDTSLSLRSSREFVESAVARCGDALQYTSEQLRDNETVVLAAVKQFGGALEYASKRLREDENVVKAAVQQDGWALQFASERMRDNDVVVKTAIEQDINALQYASDRLRAAFQAAVLPRTDL